MRGNLADAARPKNPPLPNDAINNINEIDMPGFERQAELGCFRLPVTVRRMPGKTRYFAVCSHNAGAGGRFKAAYCGIVLLSAAQWLSINGRIKPSAKAIIMNRTAKCVLMAPASLAMATCVAKQRPFSQFRMFA
jgi:hypothetical protein